MIVIATGFIPLSPLSVIKRVNIIHVFPWDRAMNFVFSAIETLKTKSIFCQAILKMSPVKVISKSVTTFTINTTTIILMNQNSANKSWDRSPKDNFLKKSTCLIVAKNSSQTRAPHADADNWLLFLTDKSFANIVIKGSPKENFWEIILKSDQLFQGLRVILKNFFMVL